MHDCTELLLPLTLLLLDRSRALAHTYLRGNVSLDGRVLSIHPTPPDLLTPYTRELPLSTPDPLPDWKSLHEWLAGLRAGIHLKKPTSEIPFQTHKLLPNLALRGHSVLLLGPRGSGKTFLLGETGSLLKSRGHTVLDLSGPVRSHTLERTIHSALLSSKAGRPPVIVADEWPEWHRDARELLRIALDKGIPFIGAGNLCPCGGLPTQLLDAFSTSPIRPFCRCRPQEVATYLSRISGPIAERIQVFARIPEPMRDHASDAHPTLALDQPSFRYKSELARLAHSMASLQGRARPSLSDFEQARRYRAETWFFPALESQLGPRARRRVRERVISSEEASLWPD